MREHTFELPGEARLNVSVPAGAIDVETGPGREAFVRLTPLSDDEEGRDAVERATVELHGDELVVKVREKRFRFGSTREVRVEIRCPERSQARIQTASAVVRARGTLGDTQTHSASGEIELDRVEGRLLAHSASGDVRAESVREATVHTASGDIELGSSEGRIELHSASGDFTVRDAGAGPIRAQAASGDVRIGVRSGRSVSVDARSVSGDVSSDIPLDGAPDEGGGPLVEIRVNSVSGDVRIERAAEVTA